MGKDSAPKNSGAAIKGFLIIPGSESLFGAALHVHNTQSSGGGFAWIMELNSPKIIRAANTRQWNRQSQLCSCHRIRNGLGWRDFKSHPGPLLPWTPPTVPGGSKLRKTGIGKAQRQSRGNIPKSSLDSITQTGPGRGSARDSWYGMHRAPALQARIPALSWPSDLSPGGNYPVHSNGDSDGSGPAPSGSCQARKVTGGEGKSSQGKAALEGPSAARAFPVLGMPSAPRPSIPTQP